MQTQDAKNPQYKSMVHCVKSMVAKDSYKALYRGMSSPMVINNILVHVILIEKIPL